MVTISRLWLSGIHSHALWYRQCKPSRFLGAGSCQVLIYSRENISDVPLRCLASLRNEMDLISEALVHRTEAISQNHLHTLNNLLATLQLKVRLDGGISRKRTHAHLFNRSMKSMRPSWNLLILSSAASILPTSPKDRLRTSH